MPPRSSQKSPWALYDKLYWIFIAEGLAFAIIIIQHGLGHGLGPARGLILMAAGLMLLTVRLARLIFRERDGQDLDANYRTTWPGPIALESPDHDALKWGLQ